MTAEPVGDYEIAPHARFEMERRGLGEKVLRRVLATPAQRLEIRPGRHVLQSRISMGEPAKEYLIRVIVDVDRRPNVVVTAYRTSKIEKYWSAES